MQLVRDLLKKKGGSLFALSPDDTVLDALRLMAEKEIGAVLVIQDGTLKGIFSERDYARKVVLDGKSSRDLKVGQIMTERVLFVEESTTIESCMKLMTDKRVRHLPVYSNGQLAGVISIGDVVKSVIEQQEFVINQLEQYISGGKILPK